MTKYEYESEYEMKWEKLGKKHRVEQQWVGNRERVYNACVLFYINLFVLAANKFQCDRKYALLAAAAISITNNHHQANNKEINRSQSRRV